MNTGKILIRWYNTNKRDLPWRNTDNPYLIWISEVVLQQTRVDQGTAYYFKLVRKYPTIKSLAKAKESDILKIWQGLGYYSRARNMHKAAKEILEKHKGIFPDQYTDIRALKGIGDYTAAAIASFAYGLKYPVLDGNVYRFLSRYFGIDTPIQTSVAKKQFISLASDLMGNHPPDTFNQAIMEFGSLQCKPSAPDCPNCPLNSSCYAFENDSVHYFPVKNKKASVRDRYFYYLVIRNKSAVYLQKRTGKDIWQNLFEFPLIETEGKMNELNLIKSDAWKSIFSSDSAVVHKISIERKHILSHQILHTKFVELSVRQKGFKKPTHWLKVDIKKIKNYAVPRLIDRYLREQDENKEY